MTKRITPGRIALGVFAVLLLYAAAAWFAPDVEAGAFREPLRAELSRALGREVTFRDVRYSLFPYVGLTASELTIPEDPEFGIEPFAYVTEFQVGLRWQAILVGRFEIATVRMSEASVNLAQRDGVGWNAGRLIEHLRERASETGSAPRIVLENGRINFRQGTLKSPFFLNAVELDLAPPSRGAGQIEWSFEASPARTDRSEQGFGRFSGQGTWRIADGKPGEIEVEMELERSALTEAATLITGRDTGLQGRVSSRVRLDGPVNDIQLRGVLELEGLSRGGLLGSGDGGWSLRYVGKLNLAAQTFEMFTAPMKEAAKAKGDAAALDDTSAPPVKLGLLVESLLTSPRWQASVSFDSIQSTAALRFVERLGAKVPDGLVVEGTLSGSLNVPRNGEASGEIELKDARVMLQGAGPLTVPAASLRLDAGVVELLPSEMQSPSESPLTLAGKWVPATEALSFVVGMKELPLDELNAAAAVVPGAPLPPALSACSGGAVSGEVRFSREDPTAAAPWAGDLNLAGARCVLEGAASPLAVARASVAFKGDDWSAKRVAARWGSLQFDATAAYRDDAKRPLRLTADFEQLDASELERIFAPALSRRRSFFDRTFRRRAVVPAWLARRHLEATVRSDTIKIGSHTFHSLDARIYWDGVSVDIPALDVHGPPFSFTGRLAVSLAGDVPGYRLIGRMTQIDWQDAIVDADVDARASGIGPALRGQIRAEGQAHAIGLVVDGEPLHNASACFDYDARRPAGTQLRLRCLDAIVDGDALTGTGGSAGDGRIVAEISSPRRVLRLTGDAWPVTLDIQSGSMGHSR